ncbi:MAG: hypothetical protein IJA12_04645 [Oscillospiraceae bacterium]|nr:hypothetical protein [Oscillospiraceae bacterium]
MKKTLKKLFAGISAVSVLMSGFLNTVTASSINDYVTLDDKSIFNNSNSDYNMCYRKYESTGKTVLYKMSPVFNQIDFVLSNDVDFDEVNDSIIEIIDEYCPNNNYNSDAQSSEIYTYIKANTTVTPTKYTVTFYYENTSETLVKELQEKSDAIMNNLNDEKLISEFYGIGNNYSLLEYVFFNYFSYITDSVDETMLNNIENYIEENNLNCTIIQRTIDTEQFSEEILLSDEINVYSLVPADDISFDEYFSVVADLYDEFDVKPFTCTSTDIPSIINGKNSLEDLPPSTTPAETIPTETTTTTISTTVTTELTTEPAETTTVTTQPTTTSSSELTTTTTTVTTITTPQPTEQPKTLGDADGDNELTVRDCSFIALTIAQGRNDELSDSADFNKDGEVSVRDAAAIAKSLAQMKS